MENTVCSRYRVVGIKEAIYRLKDAIENSNGNVGNVLQNLGLATCDFGDSELLSEIQWRVLDVTDFDDINESNNIAVDPDFIRQCHPDRAERRGIS